LYTEFKINFIGQLGLPELGLPELGLPELGLSELGLLELVHPVAGLSGLSRATQHQTCEEVIPIFTKEELNFKTSFLEMCGKHLEHFHIAAEL
jgi:hypothetical protein